MQCSSLLSQEMRQDYVEDIQEEYEEVRQDHYDNLKVIRAFRICYLNSDDLNSVLL